MSGWAAQNRVFWLVPDIVSDQNFILCRGVEWRLQGIALVGAATIATFQNIQTYVIDSFTLYSASGEELVRLMLAHSFTCFSSSQLLQPLPSCARWLALAFRCSLRRCTNLSVTEKVTPSLLWSQLLWDVLRAYESSPV